MTIVRTSAIFSVMLLVRRFRFLTVPGWVLFFLSVVIGLMVFPLFFIELKEPISSGNDGATGIMLRAFWVIYLLSLAMVGTGRHLEHKSVSKIIKYGAIFFITQFLVVYFLSVQHPDSTVWNPDQHEPEKLVNTGYLGTFRKIVLGRE